ncbi:MAG: hypothetical protein K6G26_10425 [Lachnospiraceae bacterium]|nr:hypothetical protein [Lachnospiraceae bacterium]
MGKQQKEDFNLKQINQGIDIVSNNDIFSNLVKYYITIKDRNTLGRNTPAISNFDGYIFLNKDVNLKGEQWAFAICHCILHNCFGHYDLDKVPGYFEEKSDGKKVKKAKFNQQLWNIACDIYIDKFLNDLKIGKPVHESPVGTIPDYIMEDEIKIYNYLINNNWSINNHIYGVGDKTAMDMEGLNKPVVYTPKYWHLRCNTFAEDFAHYLAKSVSKVINDASCTERDNSFGREIANWFVSSFPLLGAIASSFKIIDSTEECRKYDISIAAVDAYEGIIYINTANSFSKEEWKFIMAHEFLHAALLHHNRSAGRDHYLWNVATDYVINGWLHDMKVGVMPVDILYDESLKNMSAEEVYDEIVCELKKYMKKDTFRGYGKGDILGRGAAGTFGKAKEGMSLDDFYRNALSQGLEYETNVRGRTLIPAGLIQEIRALSVPPVPWDVKLSRWFNEHIKPLEKHRSYAHPSRRQSSTPDIPRPKYVRSEDEDKARTFGVIIDTSGSMSVNEIGKALGAVASYAASRDVLAARVIFCDATAYDAGYMTPCDIAGRVKVIGRGGTRLQPGINMLQNAKDFPKDGPILIITDGGIEPHLDIKREHAYILPSGCSLPFRAKNVFTM